MSVIGGDYSHHWYTITSSKRWRLTVNGVARGWAVSRPGRDVTVQEHSNLEWLIGETLVQLPALVGKLETWRNLAGGVPAEVRKLLYAYFKVPINAADAVAKERLRKIKETYETILGGIRDDTELQLVDTADKYRAHASGYVSVFFGSKGRIHLNFQSLKPNDGLGYHTLVHEASHKFADTQDFADGYFNEGINLYNLIVDLESAGGRPDLSHVWRDGLRPLTEDKMLKLADAYGAFAWAYRDLRTTTIADPWK